MKSVIPDSDPLWYKDAIIYELHVKAFFDSNGDGIGDFPGLMQKLDYLQSLGVTCIWLLPFYPSPLRDDGYDIADYRGVHPSYGNRRDFRQFVEEAHRRGLRVITELVINHTSDQHPWFQAARTAPSGTSKRDFYVWSDTAEKYRDARIIFTDSEPSNWTWDPVAKAYFWHRFFHHQPDLNFENHLVLRAVQRVMDFWLEMGVDGLRLDAIPYLAERDGTSCENLGETHRILKEIRRHLDQHHRGKMLLAEANQWPDDVRPYFGDGDECHMAYHFPLMPRIFMALSQEDRHPITEIMWRTPQIPSTCQWALFLRNHDELTLEMVTDEERDYMYYAYAADPRMRINIGIRRRLAPLMENDRRRIELLNSLLFSFPGTPIVYYGDEIGMGDNVYLGDRNGVRTPMQWTGDRNAGFSRADFEKLYSPPILHPVYGYQAVNVEAQERDPSSLLNWMKQIIALRKRSHIFGRGDILFLAPKNRKVLAYLRQYGGETVLCVANLSRLSQPVELDLAEFSGMVPIEMAGRTEFPPIGEKPYFLSLNPYSFFWFEFQRRRETGAISALAPLPEGATLETIEFEGQWDSLLRPSSRDRLEGAILPGFLARQRWFGSKARSIREVRISDSALLNSSSTQAAFLILCEVDYEDGEHETYLTPLKILTGQAADDVLRDSPGAVLAQAIGPAGHGVLVDALVDDAFCQFMLASVASRREIGTRLGRVRGERYAPFDEAHKSGSDPLPVFRSSGEQSNSNIIYGNRLIMKLFRKVEPGPNPDFEITHFLTDRTDFRRVPQTAGAIEYAPRGGKPATLAMLQLLVPNQGSAWDHALGELERYFERAMAGQAIPAEVAESGRRSLLDLAFEPQPAWVDEIVGSYLGSAALLGERSAELHLALSEDWEDPAFSPELFTESDFEHLLDEVRGRTRAVMATLAQVVDRLDPGHVEHARQLLALRQSLEARLEAFARSEVVTDKIRCHGDYHLGQVLWAESDFVILDFEGEPARKIAERRAKQCALKDVAGMIRSFGYAAYAALFKFTERRPEELERLEPWALLWQQRVSARYLRAYRERAGKASFVPAESDQFSDLLEIFVLEKAVYELQYEMNNRPDWILIPIRGIISLIEGASSR